MNMKLKIFVILSALMVFTGLVSASTFENVTTVITDTIPIFSAIGELIIGIFPILIIVALIGFILGIFDSILSAVSSKLGGL